MTDDKKRPTRRNVLSNLDDLRDAAGADVPDVPEVKITTVPVDLLPDERTGNTAPDDPDDDGPDGVEVTVHTRYDRDAGKWVDARDDGDRDAVTDE